MAAYRLTAFLETFSPDPNTRGAQWEVVCQWFLKTDPVYRTQLTDVWLWKEWPGRPYDDERGIDLVARATNGTLWAIQAKCYAPTRNVTKHDMDRFLTESARQVFAHRLLLATSNTLSRKAHDACAGNEKPVGWLLRHDLERRNDMWPDSYATWAKGVFPKPKLKTPRPHQKKALQDTLNGLRDRDRVQILMACATGKTLTALWLSEHLEATRTLVMVPSIQLVKQTIKEWVDNRRSAFEILPVCSDDTVRHNDPDPAVTTTAELGYPATTNAEEVQAFLKEPGPRVMFSTYQSSLVVARALAGTGLRFDLMIADEAHRCAGKVRSHFATVLDKHKIPAEKRVFMTATPRTYKPGVVKAAAENNWEVASMDDTEIFGPVVHELSLGKAIEAGLVSDYRVVIGVIGEELYRRSVERQHLLELEGGEQTDAGTLAAHLGLLKAMRDYDMRRVITFHNSRKKAALFANNLPKVIAWMPSEEAPTGPLWTKAVYGSPAMTSGQRQRHLDRLGAVGDDERGVLSNVRCLGEGVNVPTVDGIAFINPKWSQNEIVQAVGRAIRKSDKEGGVATIVVPIFIGPEDEQEQTLNASPFREVGRVLFALRSHDTVLAEELDSCRHELGVFESGSSRLPTKIILDVPRKVGTAFSTAIRTTILRNATESWPEWLGRLEEYVRINGHARVPRQYTTPDGQALGAWVVTQRGRKRSKTLSADRIQQLDGVREWLWEPVEAAWEDGYAKLEEYVRVNGRTPGDSYITEDGFKLGVWLGSQTRHRKSTLTAEKRQRLKNLIAGRRGLRSFTLGIGAPKRVRANWDDNFALLEEYVRVEGHAEVPKPYRTDSGIQLGWWVQTQRQRRQNRSGDSLSAAQKKKLESLEKWKWKVGHTTTSPGWESRFQELQAYVKTHGHVAVPFSFRTASGFALNTWINDQKKRYRTGRLEPERVRKLESFDGWEWARVGRSMESTLGPKVRAIRRSRGITQAELARRLGISASYLNLIEHNRRAFTADLLVRLAECLPIDIKTKD